MRLLSILAAIVAAVFADGASAQRGIGTIGQPQTAPAPVINPQVLRTPLNRITVAGPMELTIIDPGYADPGTGNTRTLTFAACVADKNGNPGKVTAMHYQLETPGSVVMGSQQLGEMGPYFEPSRPAGLLNATPQPPKLIGQCRRAKIDIPKCELAAGDYDLIIMAEVEGVNGVMVAKGKARLAPFSTSVGFYPDNKGVAIGTSVQVSGWLNGNCGARPTKVEIYSDNMAGVVSATLNGMQFSAPVTFIRPGPTTLRVVASDNAGKAATSQGSASMTVNKVPFSVQFSGLPETMPLGSSALVAITVINQDTKKPAAGLPVRFRLSADSTCDTVIGSNGSATCSLSVTKTPSAKGSERVVGLDIAGASAITSTGRDKTMVVGLDGMMSMTIKADTVAENLASAQPYGVLLHSFNPSWTGTGAHLDNGSIMYTDSEGKTGKPFDIPSIKPTDDIAFYLDSILLRMTPLVLSAPARVTGGFFITGANNRAPRIKGFCFAAVPCWAPPGYDEWMPDINNIAIKNGEFAVDLSIVNGHVVATLSSIDATLDFTCGGVAAPFCPLVRAKVNDVVSSRLKALPQLKTTVQQIGARLDNGIQTMLPVWKIKTLKSISFGADGSMTVTGTPLTN